jgi:hypothetical protein
LRCKQFETLRKVCRGVSFVPAAVLFLGVWVPVVAAAVVVEVVVVVVVAAAVAS